MGGGCLGIILAVTFSEFPRSVLIIPAVGLPVLIFLAVVGCLKVWRGYQLGRVMVATADEVEEEFGPAVGARFKKAAESARLRKAWDQIHRDMEEDNADSD